MKLYYSPHLPNPHQGDIKQTNDVPGDLLTDHEEMGHEDKEEAAPAAGSPHVFYSKDHLPAAHSGLSSHSGSNTGSSG